MSPRFTETWLQLVFSEARLEKDGGGVSYKQPKFNLAWTKMFICLSIALNYQFFVVLT